MADAKPTPPMPGQELDGYRYLGGDPSKQENWLAVGDEKSALPKMEDNTVGKAVGAASRVGGMLKDLTPAAAAIGAGVLDPIAAPVTAPLAYAATEGLVSPKTIKEHPIREGLTAASMAIPGPAEAVGYAFPKFAVEHPALMRGIGAAAGGALGSIGGRQMGPYGEGIGGATGAILGGYGVGGMISKGSGEKLVEDVLRGSRSVNELPERLLPTYLREARARAEAQVQLALERGEKPDLVSIPVGIRDQTQKMFEERARMKPFIPNAVLTPEQIQEAEQAARIAESQKGLMRPAAQVRGMAHAAGEHEPEWIPAKRGTTSTLTRTSRLRPMIGK